MIAVFDIDGVLADASNRQHHVERRPKDWDAFFAEVGEDPHIEHGLARLREVGEQHEVVLLSGRPESTRADTESWLAARGVVAARLVLRAERDHRPAADLKADLIRGIGTPAQVVVVVDDDPAVVERLAGLGYNTELFR